MGWINIKRDFEGIYNKLNPKYLWNNFNITPLSATAVKTRNGPNGSRKTLRITGFQTSSEKSQKHRSQNKSGRFSGTKRILG
jgi:hypothetical protein